MTVSTHVRESSSPSIADTASVFIQYGKEAENFCAMEFCQTSKIRTFLGVLLSSAFTCDIFVT